MFTRFTMSLMAGALALASTLTPTEVRAGNDAAKVIAGIAVGAIIGAAIVNNEKKRRHHGGHVSRGHHDGYGGHKAGHYRGHDRGYDRHRGHDRHHGYGHRRVNLPNACRVHKGHRSGYSGNCLGSYNYTYAALPAACAVRVGGYHGTIYRDRCLNQYGYY